MFGVWRFLLAIEVVIYHLAAVPVIGEYAVFGFFVLSGFLMTAIMQGTYGYSRRGFIAYLQNRALRLYPNYWFAMIVSLALIAWLGASQVQAFNPHMIIPPDPASWLENVSMIFFSWFPKEHIARLVPPTWALTVEIFYYLLIGLGASRTKGLTFIWLLVSIAYVIGAYAAGGGGPNLYSAVPAGSLPFATGALTWHYRTDIFAWIKVLHIDRPVLLILLRWLSCAGFTIANMLTGQGWLISLGNYVNVGLSAIIVCALFQRSPDKRLRRFDKSIGDFSYPIYLLHWQGSAIASTILFGTLAYGLSLQGLVTAVVGLGVTIGLGLVCVRLIDPTIERQRARIRQRAR
jgi:peptidoglycan/LPS O-acetylase OafA/YrhL